MKIPIGVIRKHTTEGLKFLRFEIGRNPFRREPGEALLLEGLAFDPNEKMVEVFKRVFGRNYDGHFYFSCLPPDLPASPKPHPNSEREILTWAFCVNVEGAEELEQLKDIQLLLGEKGGGESRTLFKYLAEFPPETDNLWEAFNRILQAIFAENTPSLIPYGESEMSVRAAGTTK